MSRKDERYNFGRPRPTKFKEKRFETFCPRQHQEQCPNTNAKRPSKFKAVLDPLLTDKEEGMANVAIDSSVGCGDHAIIDFRIQRMPGKGTCRVRGLNLQTLNSLENF